MLTSIIVPAKTPEDVIRYVERESPDALAHAYIERVFEVAHVTICWPTHTINIIPKSAEL